MESPLHSGGGYVGEPSPDIVCTVGSNSRSPELEGVGLEVHALVRVTGPWLELPELVDTDTQGLVMYLARIHNLLLLSLLLSKKLTVGGHSVKAKPKRNRQYLASN